MKQVGSRFHVFMGIRSLDGCDSQHVFWLQERSNKPSFHRHLVQSTRTRCCRQVLNFKQGVLWLAASDCRVGVTPSPSDQFSTGRNICIENQSFYWYRLSFHNCHIIRTIARTCKEHGGVQVVLGNQRGVRATWRLW
jgi:hypothetical protein